ncbi:MAG: amidohydrolase family protein [Planctomycetota bacterium]
MDARTAALASALLLAAAAGAQRPGTWRCAHVLAEDGSGWREDQVVVTVLSDIVEVRAALPGEAVDVDFGDAYLIPGLIDLHTHLLLRPYDLESWNDQVSNRSDGLRTLRGAQFAADTLRAGWLAVRDLGTEGAGHADVDLVRGLDEGRFRGPRIYPSTRAIAQRGRYGPSPDDPSVRKGAQMVSGIDEIVAAVREQVAGGATWIKVYADYGYGPGGSVAPTFSLEELTALCDEAKRLGRPVAAHATTDEGMRRAALAGVATIEHGHGGSDATFALMKERSVALCPCLAANAAIVAYRGGKGPIVDRLNVARIGFQRALQAGVTIACGSDAGVFRHGDNARELELMVDYGMTPEQALCAATSTAAAVLGATDLGAVRPGVRGFVVLDGDPLLDIRNVRRVIAVVREVDELPLLRDR